MLFTPEVVVKPNTPQQISDILKLANKHLIPVTPRAAGTGLSGGALPVMGGIILSVERFNKIIEIDERNLQATVEPGVINEVFQNAVAQKGLFYPPDPASKGSCFMGGNVAENSGGPKCVKYGVTKDYILNLEVVLPTGEIIYTGANTLKNSTGYHLTQLMVGSEGTLGPNPGNPPLVHAPVGIKEYIPNLTVFTCYPNPTSGSVTLQYSLNQSGKVGVVVTDLSGKVIYSCKATEGRNGINNSEINLSFLNDGAYILNLNSENNSFSKKIIKIGGEN